MPDTAWCKNS